MKTISIGKAFSAMLWVIEKENEIADSDMVGMWNFYDQKTPLKPIDYTGLINALGYNYFDKSLYQGIEDKINLTNIIDGGRVLTPDNELICQPKELSKVEELEEWVSHEIDNQFFRFGHSKHQSDSEEYVCSVKEKPVDKKVEKSPEEELAELMAQFNSPEGIKAIKQRQRDIKMREEENRTPKIPVKLADTLAASTHLQLLELLKASNLQAYYYPAIVKFKDELTNPVKSTQIAKPINTAYWFLKPLPHYDVNAIHFGDAHKLYFTKHALSELGAGEHKIPPYHYFWYANIQIEIESFEKYIMPLIYNHFPIPEKASLMSSGNKYIINFGEDKNVEVKQSIALRALSKIIHHRSHIEGKYKPLEATFIRGSVSYDKEEISDRHFDYDIPESDLTNDGDITNPSLIKARSVISRLRQTIRAYWYDESENPEDIKETENKINKLAKVLVFYTNDETYEQNISILIGYKEELERSGMQDDEVRDKLNTMLDTVLPYETVESKVSSSEDDKKETNALWKTIKSGLDSIKDQCPHLYFHLLSSGPSDGKGGFMRTLRIEGKGILYQPSKRIIWELGSK